MRNRTSPTRGGFSLLEVLLSLLIAVLLLAALYSAISTQLNNVQTSREQVEASTLARALVVRINNDVSGTVGLANAARFRMPASSSSTTAPAGSSSSAASSSPSSPSSSPSSTPPTGITIPLGVQGDATTLNLYTSRVPTEIWDVAPDGQTVVVGDTRRITYWLIEGGEGKGGLARNEIKVATSPDSTTDPLPANIDQDKAIIASEVRSLEFRYFDGTTWQDTWDSTTMGADGVTPIGSPRAIEITLGLARPGRKDHDAKKYRHVIFIPTANGTTPQPDSPQPIGGGTSAP